MRYWCTGIIGAILPTAAAPLYWRKCVLLLLLLRVASESLCLLDHHTYKEPWRGKGSTEPGRLHCTAVHMQLYDEYCVLVASMGRHSVARLVARLLAHSALAT